MERHHRMPRVTAARAKGPHTPFASSCVCVVRRPRRARDRRPVHARELIIHSQCRQQSGQRDAQFSFRKEPRDSDASMRPRKKRRASRREQCRRAQSSTTTPTLAESGHHHHPDLLRTASQPHVNRPRRRHAVTASADAHMRTVAARRREAQRRCSAVRSGRQRVPAFSHCAGICSAETRFVTEATEQPPRVLAGGRFAD